MQGLLHKVARGCQAVEQVRLVCLAVRIAVSEERIRVQPAGGDHTDSLLYHFWSQKPFRERVRLLKSTGRRKEHMLFVGREWAAAAREEVPGAMMKVER